jgi:hypothetical protein
LAVAGSTPPDHIADTLTIGQVRDHGDPARWTYPGKKAEPATERRRLAGSKKAYEVFLDENGKQIEWHYWVNPDGTIDGGKVVFPGTTAHRALSK